MVCSAINMSILDVLDYSFKCRKVQTTQQTSKIKVNCLLYWFSSIYFPYLCSSYFFIVLSFDSKCKFTHFNNFTRPVSRRKNNFILNFWFVILTFYCHPRPSHCFFSSSKLNGILSFHLPASVVFRCEILEKFSHWWWKKSSFVNISSSNNKTRFINRSSSFAVQLADPNNMTMMINHKWDVVVDAWKTKVTAGTAHNPAA